MKSLECFKTEMTSQSMPNYIRKYVEDLDCFGWERFYFLMFEPMLILDGNEGWLLHCLKWFLKEKDLSDLTESVFFQLYTDPEGDAPDIGQTWWDIMCERYLVESGKIHHTSHIIGERF
ncbi:MAG: hypothetical protein WBI82_13710 [Sphaerochaeta sp.]